MEKNENTTHVAGRGTKIFFFFFFGKRFIPKYRLCIVGIRCYVVSEMISALRSTLKPGPAGRNRGVRRKCVCARPFYGAVWDSARGTCWYSRPLPTKTSRLFIQSSGMCLFFWRIGPQVCLMTFVCFAFLLIFVAMM